MSERWTPPEHDPEREPRTWFAFAFGPLVTGALVALALLGVLAALALMNP